MLISPKHTFPSHLLKKDAIHVCLHHYPYPRSYAVLPGGFPEPSPGHTAVGTGEPQFNLSPVGSGQKLEPETVRLRQAAVHTGQTSPGTPSRGWRRRKRAAALSVHVHIPQVLVILQRNWLTAWREPVPLGQHGISRSSKMWFLSLLLPIFFVIAYSKFFLKSMLHLPPPSVCL